MWPSFWAHKRANRGGPSIRCKHFEGSKRTALTLQLVIISDCCYFAAQISLKLSIGLLLLPIMVAQWQRVTMRIAVGLSSLSGVVFLCLTIFACGRRFNYLANTIEGMCLTYSAAKAIAYSNAIVVTLTDVTLTLLPVSLAWRLRLNRPAKVAVFCIIFMGLM